MTIIILYKKSTLMGLFSCCKHTAEPLSSVEYQVGIVLHVLRNGIEPENDVVTDEPRGVEDNLHEKSYHSSDSEIPINCIEDEEGTLRGVSNVVYRKE